MYRSCFRAALTHDEIARIGMEYRWKDGPRQQLSGSVAGVCGTVAFSVALKSTAKAWENVLVLLRSRDCSRCQKGNRINKRAHRQPIFLFRQHRRRIPVEA